MTIKDLQNQIAYLLKQKMVNENDEIILLGSGDRQSGLLNLGLCMPKVDIEISEHHEGHYGLGIANKIVYK